MEKLKFTKTAGKNINDIKNALCNIEVVLELRNARLKEYENYLLERLKPDKISLLNPSGRKNNFTQYVEEFKHIQLECKLLKRNLFILRQRKAMLEQALRELETPQDTTA